MRNPASAGLRRGKRGSEAHAKLMLAVSPVSVADSTKRNSLAHSARRDWRLTRMINPECLRPRANGMKWSRLQVINNNPFATA